MSIWDSLGGVQKTFGDSTQVPNVKNYGRIPFGVSLDTAKNLPSNPGSWNDKIETARATTLKGANVVLGRTIGVPFQALDKATSGQSTRILSLGTQNVRSNYAFMRAEAEDNLGMSLLAGLGMIAGGTLGAIGGFTAGAFAGGIGAIPGAVAGAVAGAGLAGGLERKMANKGQLDFISKDLKKNAMLSESKVGQEHYNFGRDVVHLASNALNIKTLGDTTKGIGAVTSGLLNFGFEVTAAPDIKVTQVAGRTIRTALVGGITQKSQGLVADTIDKMAGGYNEAMQAERLVKDIDVIKRTSQGEKTIYTPLFDFLQKNDPATIKQRPEFKNNDMGHVAANILSGKSAEEIGLVLRVGRGDREALAELEAKHADTFAELNRYQSGVNAASKDGVYWFRHKNDILMLGNKFKDENALVKSELDVLQGKYDHLNKALSLDHWLQTDRTVSRFAWVERYRNDMAKLKSATKLGKNAEKSLVQEISPETKLGGVIMSAYQKNGLSAPIWVIDRTLDDSPRFTINFNEGIQATDRVRTSIRSAVAKGVLNPAEGLTLYNKFLTTANEGEKALWLEDYAKTVITKAAEKHNLHPSVKELAIAKYNETHGFTKQAAVEASSNKKAYMVAEDGKAISDPQLISQLANGGFLPDVRTIDTAFKQFALKRQGITKAAQVTAYSAKAITDEINSIWRGMTLLRGGFPINILRDANFRAWGDASLFYVYKNLGEDTWDSLKSGSNTVKKINNWVAGAVNKDKNLANVVKNISDNKEILDVIEKELKDMKYDPKNPPKELSPELEKILSYQQRIQGTYKELKRQEEALVKGIPSKVVGRDKITVSGWTFPAKFSGSKGAINESILSGKEDLRGAIASLRELQMANIRRGTDGGRVVHATEDEALHLAGWETVLNGGLKNDPVARMIMEGKSEGEILRWIDSPSSKDYVQRFGLVKVEEGRAARPLNAGDDVYIYNRVKYAVDSVAPSQELRDLVLQDKLDATQLKKLYPKLEERPPIATDMVNELLGTSELIRKFTGLVKDKVAWLATVPTSKLMYNHFFALKYEEKLQSLVHSANNQGIIPNATNRIQFENIARSYALNEYKQKINAFSRDMNYSGILNYTLAFFPALVEQFRAYGRLTLEQLEFPLRMVQMAVLPEYTGLTKKDSKGKEYVEATLPWFGIKARVATSWFNPVNPTGGTLVSAGPLTVAVTNEYVKRTNAENVFTNFALQFGSQSNSLQALTPNTVKRGAQLFQAYVLGNGEQFNKDSNMFLDDLRQEYTASHDGKQPSGNELKKLSDEAMKRATFLAFLRFGGSLTLPTQPRYTTAVTAYQDLFIKETTKDPINGAETFSKKYPDYFMVGDRLMDSTSGINSDATAVALVKKNPDVIRTIFANMSGKDLGILGAVFNDADYAFSPAAQTYLISTNIPGTKQKFKESAAFLDSAKTSIVNKGWRDFFKLQEIVKQEISKPPYNLNPNKGYGAAVLKSYEDSFISAAKTNNPLWYNEKQDQGFGGGKSRQADTVRALTIAANTPEMWKDLAKQPRWHTIVKYLNFRYEIYDKLKQRDTSIDNKDAVDIRNIVEDRVAQLKQEDITFSQFYERYFRSDKFDFVVEDTGEK